MGLDMNLYIARREYAEISEGDYPTKKIGEIAKKHDASICKLEEVRYEMMYWRKANQIHKWFVDKCADGVDECQQIYVERSQLMELYTTCLEVMADHSQARILLPTREGFFFGSTDYDDYYYEQVKETLDFLKEFLDELKKPEYHGYEVIYQASW